MVSFIIVNYNSCAVTTQCVDSIFRYMPQGTFEVVVVDNGSGSNELAELRQMAADRCKLVESKFNGGFGMGNMLGANVAQGDYLCFINNDAYLQDDCVSPLCAYLHDHPDAACITPQQRDGDGRFVPAFKHSLGIGHTILPNQVYERLRPSKYPPRHDYSWTAPFVVREINGSFMLFKTDVFWEIGGFDTNIFLYREEYDLGFRVREHGYNCVVHPLYSYCHKHAATTRTLHDNTRIEELISNLYAYSKHHCMFKSLIFWVMLVLTKIVFVPTRWSKLPIFLSPDPMSKSMRHKACKGYHKKNNVRLNG